MDKGLFLVYGQLLQHIRTDSGMALHYIKFFRSKSARLVKDTVRNGDLAYIVKSGGGYYPENIAVGKIIFICLFDKMLEKKPCERLDMMNVHTTLTVAELNDMTKDIYHHAIVLFLCIDLLFNNA